MCMGRKWQVNLSKSCGTDLSTDTVSNTLFYLYNRIYIITMNPSPIQVLSKHIILVSYSVKKLIINTNITIHPND